MPSPYYQDSATIPLDLDNIPAGPDLDALVAEKVLGWTCWNIRNGICYTDRWSGNAPDCWLDFSPSTNITAAWEMVEKLWKLKPTEGISVTAEELAFHFDGEDWSVGFLFDATLDCGHHSMGDPLGAAKELPLAICRAALKAVTNP
jgi:hypothetical protein